MTNRQIPIWAVALMAVSPMLVQAQGYGGPSMLSRGGNRPGIRGRAPIDFNVYFSTRGIYESGLITTRLSDTGEIVPVDSYGVQAEVGLYGGKDWRRHSLGVDYRADYRHQPAYPGLNGTNQALSLQTQHRLSRRVLLMLQQTGGTSNRAFGGFAAPVVGGIGRLGVPMNELFDLRIYYAQSAAILNWQRSARTSVYAGVDGFFIKRKSMALINGQGYRASAGWNYRMTRKTTLLGNFQYLHFNYPRVYSQTDSYAPGLGVQYTVSRNVQIDALAGLYFLRSAGVQQVALSPEVAAILGRSTGSAAFLRNEKVPMFQGTLSYLQERGRAFVSASSGVTPGNGAFLTTRRTMIGSGYSYSGIRRTSLGVSAGWSRYGSALLDLRSFTQWQSGGGISYKLAEHLSLMAQADRRWFKGSGQLQGRTGNSISIGLAYTPSRFPISIW